VLEPEEFEREGAIAFATASKAMAKSELRKFAQTDIYSNQPSL